MYRKKWEAERRISTLRAEIDRIAGRELRLGANAATDEFKRFLYEEQGLPVLKSTAKNRDAADDEALILLKEYCEASRPDLVKLLEAVQEYRKWSKILATYIDGFLHAIHPVTGRIHPEFFPLGTDTGRFSCRRPNMQNCVRTGNDPIGVRNFFTAREGHVLLDFDFSQIELRVGAFYCQDERMLSVYREGGDIHAQTTALIYGIPLQQAQDKNAENYKERRSAAKSCVFGIFYGLYPHGLQRNLKFKAGLSLSLFECEEFITNLKAGYPGLAIWQDRYKRSSEFKMYTETLFGRRRFLPGIRAKDWGTRSYWQRCALNTPIQGTAADILKLAMARILAGIPDKPYILPLLTIHDELVFEVPEEKAEEATAFIKACMEAPPLPDFDVPIKAEGARGKRFGDMEELT
jgi:DNA polymerase-1